MAGARGCGNRRAFVCVGAPGLYCIARVMGNARGPVLFVVLVGVRCLLIACSTMGNLAYYRHCTLSRFQPYVQVKGIDQITRLYPLSRIAIGNRKSEIG